ncbi:MAG TPA: membrane protein insertase YidC [Micromonosporaceae bacterium]
MSLDWIYWAISWILLTWHGVWDSILPGRAFLATNWDWILAIFFLVVTVRIILFPIFVKQIKSQRAMQALQPKVKELQEKHKGDRETLQKEMMELYRREKANPLMGCLPMFLQIPVFLGLFHTLRHIKPTMPEGMRTLYGWTADQFNSAVGAKLLGAPIYQSFNTGGTNTKIVAGVLVVIMMVTTYLTSRQMILKTGWAEDPQQKMIQRLMLYGIPFSLLISGGIFPIGVIVYWVTNNLFTLGQQQWVLHKYPPPVIPTKAIPGKATPGRAAAAKPGAARSAGKPGAAKSAAKNGSGAPVIDGKALAPKPGAKPVNPKKGGTAKRRSG